ncbi:MAG: glucosylceramidase [Clostridiales bacterium]|nr:glucosylceramidase [Clostridiales bacterium]
MNFNAIRTNIKDGIYWQPFTPETKKADHSRLISLYPDVRYQTVQGFGGAFTEAAGDTWLKLAPAARDECMQAYFGEEGLRYTLGRAHMGSCDFALGNYACVDDPHDDALNSFSMERDEKYILPMILKAQEIAGREIGLLLSPWSPPAFMKSNGEMNNGGKLLMKYADRWARCIAEYVKRYRAAGACVTMITVQNEPEARQLWDSCLYTAREEGRFVSGFLGPALERANLRDVRLLVWDHNKERMLRRVTETLADGQAKQYVTGVAFHWYTGDHFENVAMTAQRFPELELIFTEGCVEFSRYSQAGETENAEMYAHDILGNLNAGAHGIIDWNLLLDAQGGPNHKHNFCQAPLMATASGGVERKASYYYIGHFSRYIHPGAVRIGLSRYTDTLEAAALQNPDGSIAAVFLNRGEEPKEAFLEMPDGKACCVSLNAHEIVSILLT